MARFCMAGGRKRHFGFRTGASEMHAMFDKPTRRMSWRCWTVHENRLQNSELAKFETVLVVAREGAIY